MKRAIVVSVRTSKDTKTGEDTAWLTLAVMPSKTKDGRLYLPKSTDVPVNTSAAALRTPDKFTKYRDFKIGDLVDIHYALNDFTQKVFVEDITLVANSPYDMSQVIV